MILPLSYSIYTMNSITEVVLQSAWKWGHTFKLQLVDQLNLYDQCSIFFWSICYVKKQPDPSDIELYTVEFPLAL